MLRLSWLISMAISFFGVMIIEHFFALTPDNTDRGGNLGAFGLALVTPFLLLSIFISFRYFLTLSRNALNGILRMAFILLGVLFVSVMFQYALDYKDNVYASLGGTTTDPQSLIYGYPILNEYTNQVFVNLYTFAFVHGIVAIIAAIIGMFKEPIEQPLQKEEL